MIYIDNDTRKQKVWIPKDESTYGSTKSQYEQGYEDGFASGFSSGYSSGVQYTQSLHSSVEITENGTYQNPDAWSSVTVNVNTAATYEQGFQDGYQSGWSAGFESGVSVGFSSGWTEGFDSGFTSGETVGFESGWTEGFDSGYTSGFSSGESVGFESGYTQGFDSGFSSGESVGFESGYSEGFESGYTSGASDGFSSGYSSGTSEIIGTFTSMTVTENGVYGSSANPLSSITVDCEEYDIETNKPFTADSNGNYTITPTSYGVDNAYSIADGFVVKVKGKYPSDDYIGYIRDKTVEEFGRIDVYWSADTLTAVTSGWSGETLYDVDVDIDQQGRYVLRADFESSIYSWVGDGNTGMTYDAMSAVSLTVDVDTASTYNEGYQSGITDGFSSGYSSGQSAVVATFSSMTATTNGVYGSSAHPLSSITVDCEEVELRDETFTNNGRYIAAGSPQGFDEYGNLIFSKAGWSAVTVSVDTASTYNQGYQSGVSAVIATFTADTATTNGVYGSSAHPLSSLTVNVDTASTYQSGYTDGTQYGYGIGYGDGVVDGEGSIIATFSALTASTNGQFGSSAHPLSSVTVQVPTGYTYNVETGKTANIVQNGTTVITPSSASTQYGEHFDSDIDRYYFSAFVQNYPQTGYYDIFTIEDEFDETKGKVEIYVDNGIIDYEETIRGGCVFNEIHYTDNYLEFYISNANHNFGYTAESGLNPSYDVMSAVTVNVQVPTGRTYTLTGATFTQNGTYTPKGVTILDYLETEGDYVFWDTGVKITSTAQTVVFDFMPLTGSIQYDAFLTYMSQQDNDSNWQLGLRQGSVGTNNPSGNYWLSMGNVSNRTISGLFSADTRAYTVISKTGITVNGVSSAINETTIVSTNSNIVINGMYANNANYRCPYARYYGFKLIDYDGVTALAELVPALDGNGNPCFYDNVNDTFIYHQGTGNVISGNVISAASSYDGFSSVTVNVDTATSYNQGVMQGEQNIKNTFTSMTATTNGTYGDEYAPLSSITVDVSGGGGAVESAKTANLVSDGKHTILPSASASTTINTNFDSNLDYYLVTATTSGYDANEYYELVKIEDEFDSGLGFIEIYYDYGYINYRTDNWFGGGVLEMEIDQDELQIAITNANTGFTWTPMADYRSGYDSMSSVTVNVMEKDYTLDFRGLGFTIETSDFEDFEMYDPYNSMIVFNNFSLIIDQNMPYDTPIIKCGDKCIYVDRDGYIHYEDNGVEIDVNFIGSLTNRMLSIYPMGVILDGSSRIIDGFAPLDCQQMLLFYDNLNCAHSVCSVGSIEIYNGDSTLITELKPKNAGGLYDTLKTHKLNQPIEVISSIYYEVYNPVDEWQMGYVSGYTDGYNDGSQGGGGSQDLIDYIEGDLTHIDIPSGTTKIRDLAFSGMTSLSSITIPDSVVQIGRRIIDGTLVSSITIPDSVTIMAASAFQGNMRLQYASVGSGLTELPPCSFMVCTSLTGVSLAEGIQTIRGSNFSGCTNLKSIVIPDSVTSASTIVFCKCTALTAATIGSGLTNIPNFTFSGDTNLKKITFRNPNPPTLGSNGAFPTGINYAMNGTMYVPSGSYQAYYDWTRNNTTAKRSFSGWTVTEINM